MTIDVISAGSKTVDYVHTFSQEPEVNKPQRRSKCLRSAKRICCELICLLMLS